MFSLVSLGIFYVMLMGGLTFLVRKCVEHDNDSQK